MANLKFYKGGSQPTELGSVWFNNGLIGVVTSKGLEYYSGIQDASWDESTKKFTITKADGATKVELDFSDIASAKILGQLRTDLTALENKFEGLTQDTIVEEIAAEIAKLDTPEAGVTGDGTFVDVTVKQVDGVVTEVVVAENDIASAAALAQEVKDARAAEQALGERIDNIVTADGLEARIKANEDKLAGIDTTVTDAIGAAVEALEGELAETDAKTLAALNDRIDNAVADAKTYSIAAVTEGLDANVKEAYKLVDEDGTQVGETIKIYKDSSLISVALVDADAEGNAGQYLKYTYVKADGNEEIVYLNVSELLVEAEFKNGLEVSAAGEVSVKVDAASEAFLTVGADGVKLSGVQNAIDAVKTEVNGVIEENERVTAEAYNDLDERVTILEGKTDTIDSALQADDITTGSANGTIAVKGTDVAVKGLGSAAYTESTAYATADQGALADSAVQTITSGSANGTIAVDSVDVAVTGLKSAAYAETTAFDAAGAAAAVLGTDADTYESETVIGARKYAEHLVEEGLSWAVFE